MAKRRNEKDVAFNHKLIERLRRKVGGATYAEVSRRVGVTQATVANWFGGNMNAPSAANVAKICRAYDIDANWLLGVRRAEGRKGARTTSD